MSLTCSSLDHCDDLLANALPSAPFVLARLLGAQGIGARLLELLSQRDTVFGVVEQFIIELYAIQI